MSQNYAHLKITKSHIEIANKNAYASSEKLLFTPQQPTEKLRRSSQVTRQPPAPAEAPSVKSSSLIFDRHLSSSKMENVIVASPTKSARLSNTTVSAPSRVSLGEIKPTALNQASTYVDVVKCRMRTGEVSAEDVAEAESYKLELTAGYSSEKYRTAPIDD